MGKAESFDMCDGHPRLPSLFSYSSRDGHLEVILTKFTISKSQQQKKMQISAEGGRHISWLDQDWAELCVNTMNLRWFN